MFRIYHVHLHSNLILTKAAFSHSWVCYDALLFFFTKLKFFTFLPPFPLLYFHQQIFAVWLLLYTYYQSVYHEVGVAWMGFAFKLVLPYFFSPLKCFSGLLFLPFSILLAFFVFGLFTYDCFQLHVISCELSS